MNVSPRLFASFPGAARIARTGAACLALAALGACTSNPFATAPVDMDSPAAQAVLDGARADRAYPRFSDIPRASGDMRGPSQWAQVVSQVEADRDALYAQTAPSTWTLRDTEAFARRARAEATPPAPLTTPSTTEAFAREARERATPPPPPSR